MTQPPRIVIWDDLPTMNTFIRLEVDGKYVQRPVAREQSEACTDPKMLQRETLELLCGDWCRCFGERVKAIPPQAEGEAWRIEHDNTIDGEVVVKEIEYEQKAIEGGEGSATRGCIEGR